MRIHTDSIESADIYAAARLADATVEVATRHGSRKRNHAFEIKLSGNSRRRPNFYDGSGIYAATWDQWGVFLGKLFELDPTLTSPYYSDAGDFTYRTGHRFDDPDHFEHPLNHDHRFKFVGIPFSQECTKCGAVQRWRFTVETP